MDPKFLSHRWPEGADVTSPGQASDSRGTLAGQYEHPVYGSCRHHRVHHSQSCGLRSGSALFRLFGVNALHEVRHAVDGPVCIFCLELGGELLAGFIGVHALPLEIKSPSLQIDYKGFLLRHQRTVTYGAMIRKHVERPKLLPLIEYRDPARGCATLAVDVRHDLVLHHIA